MAEGDVTRRLATVVAADVAGYSRLMGADDKGTLAARHRCARSIARCSAWRFRPATLRASNESPGRRPSGAIERAAY